jgi:uncharacterized integral membrane protein
MLAEHAQKLARLPAVGPAAAVGDAHQEVGAAARIHRAHLPVHLPAQGGAGALLGQRVVSQAEYDQRRTAVEASRQQYEAAKNGADIDAALTAAVRLLCVNGRVERPWLVAALVNSSLFALVVLFVILLVQNSGMAPLRFFFWYIAAPQFFLVFFIFAIGFFVGFLAAVLILRKKRPETKDVRLAENVPKTP